MWKGLCMHISLSNLPLLFHPWCMPLFTYSHPIISYNLQTTCSCIGGRSQHEAYLYSVSIGIIRFFILAASFG